MAEPLKYAAVIERFGDDYYAYVPDLPGCGTVGGSPEETSLTSSPRSNFTSVACVKTANRFHNRTLPPSRAKSPGDKRLVYGTPPTALGRDPRQFSNIDPEFRGVNGCVRFEGNLLDPLESLLQQPAASGAARSQVSYLQFVRHDGGNPQVRAIAVQDAGDNVRVALEEMNDSVGVQELQSKDSRGESGPKPWRNSSKSGKSGKAPARRTKSAGQD